MTRSTFRGRGGARPGAGRKRKPADVQAPKEVQVAPLSDGRQGEHAQIPEGLNRQEREEFISRKLEERQFAIAMGFEEATPTEVAALRDLRDRVSGKPPQAKPKDADQEDMFGDDGWGDLLKPQPTAGRTN